MLRTNVTDPFVCESESDLPGVIGRPIVDYKDLRWFNTLLDDTGETLGQVAAVVVTWDDDRNVVAIHGDNEG